MGKQKSTQEGSNATSNLAQPLFPMNQVQLLNHLCKVRELASEFDVKLSYFGDLHTLEMDTLTWE
jgi:hypothetical protein